MSETITTDDAPSVNDVDVILSIPPTDPNLREHVVGSHTETVFSWEYADHRAALAKLYEKAKVSQWNSNDLPWHLDVDPEKETRAIQAVGGGPPPAMVAPGSPFAKWGPDEWLQLGMENQRWMLSQFLHGEQGALVCTSRLVEMVPDMDAKFYGASQVMDEARHVEVFSRYTNEKLGGAYPINGHLQALLDDIIRDSRWDMTYLGMQIMVEGLALASFGYMRQITQEPLMAEMLKMVMSDEARHVAFGVLSLKDFYDGLTQDEIRERQQFTYEAAVRMRDRFLQQEVWERMGLDVREAVKFVMDDPGRKEYQAMLFSKIVPNCRKLGLLDAGDGWLRERFTDLGVIAYEHFEDTTSEYLALDAVSA